MNVALVLAALVTAAPTTPASETSSGATGAPRERGMALGLFSSDEAYRYGELLREIKELGATDVELTWVEWQADVRANEIHAVPGWTATDAQIEDAITSARALGLRVTAFPILRLEKSAKDEWRGKIAPTDEDAWWKSYTASMVHAARLAVRAKADRLCIGSELLSREGMRARWLAVIKAVRAEAPGLELLYSANWDHFREVSFWDAVDVVGMTAYFELTKDLDADTAALERAWGLIKPSIVRFSAELGRPIVITEIGYPSLDGGAAWPWDETRQAKVDAEEQRRAYEAFVRSWSSASFLGGVYFWNWFGFGGPDDASYTPRHKPAAEIIRRWYRDPAPRGAAGHRTSTERKTSRTFGDVR